MFIYEKNGKLNIMISDNKPAVGKDADIVIEASATNPNEAKIVVNSSDVESVVANPTATGDEDALERIKIGQDQYSVGGGSGAGVCLIDLSDVNFEYDAEGSSASDKSYIATAEGLYDKVADALTNGIPVYVHVPAVVGEDPHDCAMPVTQFFIDFDENDSEMNPNEGDLRFLTAVPNGFELSIIHLEFVKAESFEGVLLAYSTKPE